MKLFHVFAVVALVTAIPSKAESPRLKIYTRPADTVYTAEVNVVAVTEPEAKAYINGEDMHVFPTGSFGMPVQVKPGVNTITVRVGKDGETTQKTFTVFRADESSRPKKNIEVDESTTMFVNPFSVETLSGAYLQYGNGDDRLGGSKMGYIDENIILKVIGRKGSLYCVRLAADRLAYIPKVYTRPVADNPEVVNTGSWQINNIGDADRVTISLPRRLAYQYFTDIDPQTIYIDLFGATDNSNWITQRTLDLGIIDYVDFRQISDDVYRVIIRLKGKYQWGFHVGYEGKVLTVDVRHAPRSLKLKDLTIGLDAGHGGKYPGAISPSGLKEKDLNLDIVLRLKDLLEKRGAKVVLTRDSDIGPSMAERKKVWRDAKVDLAVSVHNNSGGSPFSAPGTAVLYKHLFDRQLAECVARRLLQTGVNFFGLVGNFNFSLNGPTEFPNVLVEGLFMSSLEEESRLADPSYRQLMAEKIVAAITDYLNQASK